LRGRSGSPEVESEQRSGVKKKKKRRKTKIVESVEKTSDANRKRKRD
jgi:hypothetical protein